MYLEFLLVKPISSFSHPLKYICQMDAINKANLISELQNKVLEIKNEVHELTSMKEELLSTKPSEKVWSVLQIIEHLNITHSFYFGQFESKIEKGQRDEKDYYKPSWVGNMSEKTMRPDSKGKINYAVRTFRSLRPDVNVQYDTIEKFLSDQDRFLKILDKSSDLDFGKNRVKTVLGNFLTLKYGDALRFVTAHAERHIKQIQNTLDALAE